MPERLGRVPPREGVEEVERPVVAGDPELLLDQLDSQTLAAEGEELLEERLRVPHRPARPPGQDAEGFGVGVDVLATADLLQGFDDLVRVDPGEVVPLASREDGDRDLVRLGRGEEEFDPFGRLFEGLEQGVEGPGREHVDFVDVIDFEPGAAGPESGVLAEFADLLDSVVARPVDLDDVDVLADGDRLADVAGEVGLLGGPVDAIQALGEDPGDRRLADPSGPAEEVGVGDPIEPDGVPERLDDVVLPDHVLEPLGPIPTGDDRVTARVRFRAAGADRPSGSGHEARSVGPWGSNLGGAGISRGGAPGHMEAVLMAAAFPP